MKNLKKFHHPKKLQDALRLLNKPGKKIRPIAAGTMLSLSDDINTTELVYITDIGLNYIKSEPGRYIIGATTAAQDIIEEKKLAGALGNILKKSARAIGSQQIRNAVTIGGNICGLVPWSDFPAALLSTNAEVYLKSTKKERKLNASEFFQKHPFKILSRGEICTKIVFPKLNKNYRGEFIKIGRAAVDKTIMNVCVVFLLKEKKLSDIRIAVSGCIALPKRLTELEKNLNGIIVDKNLFTKILNEASKIKEKFNFISDLKASAQYRKDIFEVVICDAFEKAIKTK